MQIYHTVSNCGMCAREVVKFEPTLPNERDGSGDLRLFRFLLTRDQARRIAANIAKIPQYRRGGASS